MGNTVSNFVNKAVSAVKNTISDRFRRIVSYVVNHPFRTLGYITNCVLLLLPGAVTGLLLGLVGFGGSCIRADDGRV